MDREDHIRRIAALRRKAEATSSQEEAKALITKAEELMQKYNIDQMLLARAGGSGRVTEVVEVKLYYPGILSHGFRRIGQAVARAHDCKLLIGEDPWSKPKRAVLYVIGVKEDVEDVQTLDASLRLQAAAALEVWARQTAWWSKAEAYKAKREFLYGFAQGVGERFRTAKQAAKQASAAEEATRSQSTVEDATGSVELVLRDKKEHVNDWYDKRYGDNTRTVHSRESFGGYGARGGGVEAGRKASIGRQGIGRNRGIEGRR